MAFLLNRSSNAFQSVQISDFSTHFPTGYRCRPESHTGSVNWLRSHFTAGVIIACLALAQPLAAQDGKKSETPAAAATPSAPQQPAVTPDSNTDGSIVAAGQTITYRAIVGTLTVGSNDVQDAMLGSDGKQPANGGDISADQPIARMSYVAYFGKDAKDSGVRRPITFLYNGGPGAASFLLHMAAFGPRRVVVPDAQVDSGGTYNIINNEYTLLDVSDLVFVDAPGTGFGRVVGPNKEAAFWGNDPDTHAFERFVRRFLTKYNKWNSAKYLLGESYGTLRNAMLAANLPDVRFNGLIMLSQILDLNNYADGQQLNPGMEQAYALALPTYAAVAFYYHKLPSQPSQLEPFLDEVKQYALGDYMSALLQGSELTDARKQAVAAKLHDYTGLPLALLLKANLRVRASVFAKALLSDDEITTGGLDARYRGPDLDPLSEDGPYDPTLNAVLPALAAAFNQYVRTELKYETDLTYKLLLTSNDKFAWNWNHEVPSGPHPAETAGVRSNVMPDLAYAMKLNPAMKVLLTGGYYDLVTPFFAGIYEMHHLPLPKNLEANISYRYYPSGHMVYVHEDALKQFHSDVAAFIKNTENPAYGNLH
jgi:carboxypeptidase C (cathepsin A)